MYDKQTVTRVTQKYLDHSILTEVNAQESNVFGPQTRIQTDTKNFNLICKCIPYDDVQ